jgi:hypothetical protein
VARFLLSSEAMRLALAAAVLALGALPAHAGSESLGASLVGGCELAAARADPMRALALLCAACLLVLALRRRGA